MDYSQPYGTTAGSAYINGNPATGTAGSIPPAAAFENPQRELVNAISDGGITPTNADLRQLSKAIQAGRFNFGVDSGTANNLSVSLTPAVTTLVNGMRLWVFPSNANTGAATITVNALNNPIVRGSGDALRANDIVVGMPLMLEYDISVASWKALNAPLPGAQRKSIFTKFLTTGAWSWTPPVGTTSATFWLWGGGGGGGFGVAANGAGSGGAGGAFQRITLAVTPGVAVTGNLGVGGAAGVSGTGGGNGGATTAIVLGTTYTSGAGQGGTNANAGVAQIQTATSPTPATGDIPRAGDAGAGSIPNGSSNIAGGGGSSFWGGVGGQGGTGPGTGGQAPGGGGAGGANGFAAGAGARGEVWVEY